MFLRCGIVGLVRPSACREVASSNLVIATKSCLFFFVLYEKTTNVFNICLLLYMNNDTKVLSNEEFIKKYEKEQYERYPEMLNISPISQKDIIKQLAININKDIYNDKNNENNFRIFTK